MSQDQPAKDTARLTRAHVVPLAVFMSFMLVEEILAATIGWKHPDAPWWRQDPAHLIYPIQTLVTLGLLVHYWKYYEFRSSWCWNLVAVLLGGVGIACWLLPTMLYDYWHLTGPASGWLKWLGVMPRGEGFDPNIFSHPAAWSLAVAMRFVRAAVVVAFAEEIFWRGFLMRFVCDWEGDYWRQPFGRATWPSFLVVTALFVGIHAPADYAAAFVYGSLTYLLCVWSKSLAACITMHATANLIMGVYIMIYHKYGLW